MNFLLGSPEYVLQKQEQYPTLTHSISFADFICAYEEDKYTSISSYQNESYSLLCIGNIYDSAERNPAKYVLSQIEHSGISSIFKIDGDMVVFLYHLPENKYYIFADRIGIMPLYYTFKQAPFVFTSFPRILFDNFTENDIDMTSVYDFLRYGSLVGANTFSNHVKCLNGGTYISIEAFTNSYTINTDNIFTYNETNYEYDKSLLIEEISTSYTNAVRKRLEHIDIDKSCIFLSGGLDSRFLLAAINKITNKRIACYTFGQASSEEVDIARKVSNVYGNPFTHVITPSNGFLNRITEYINYTCGSDMFPQSFILNAVEEIPAETFITGYILDALLGGTFLDSQTLNTDESFSAYITKYPGKIKMSVFSDTDISTLCLNSAIFDNCKKNLQQCASIFDYHKITEVIQLFGIYNRAIRLVLNREFVPGQFMHEIFPSTDIDFLNSLAKIPPEYKLDHSFYRDLFLAFDLDYCKIPYNNTGLPVTAPIEFWKQGTTLEAQREALYSDVQQTQHSDESIVYYPHFYSDFDGYSRYDKDWDSLFQTYLLSDSAYILKWFKKDEVEKLYAEHKSSQKNNRKKLVYLLSLELFFQTILL